MKSSPRLKKMAFPIFTLLLLSLISAVNSFNTTNIKILFIGNSYTAGLPSVLVPLAAAANVTIVYDTSVAGGATLKDQAVDPSMYSDDLLFP